MKRYIKKDLPAYIAVMVFFFMLPHMVMSYPGFLGKVAYSDKSFDSGIANLYLNVVWGLMPYAGGVIALLHMLSGKMFNPLLIAEALIRICTFAFRIPGDHLIVLVLAVVPLVIMECFCLFNGMKGKEPGSKLFDGIVKNRRFLALVCFWSVIPLIMFQIQGYYLAQCNSWIANKLLVLFAMISVPLIYLTLPFFQLIEHPMTIGGFVFTLVLYAITILMAVVGYNGAHAPLEMFVIPYSVGYGIVIVLTGICAVASVKLPRM